MVGFVISLIATGCMKGQLKSVSSQSAANCYVKKGSMKVTERKDLFLYKNTERKEKEKKESSEIPQTHTSSSGITHNGGGGKF